MGAYGLRQFLKSGRRRYLERIVGLHERIVGLKVTRHIRKDLLRDLCAPLLLGFKPPALSPLTAMRQAGKFAHMQCQAVHTSSTPDDIRARCGIAKLMPQKSYAELNIDVPIRRRLLPDTVACINKGPANRRLGIGSPINFSPLLRIWKKPQ